MLAVLSWWLIALLLTLAALPLTWRLFARLPGRGYPFTKAVGLLLAAYLLWLGASLRLLPNDLGGVALALLAVAAASFWLGRAGWQADAEGRRPLWLWLREHRALVLVTEVLFLAVFAGWAAFRAYNPDIAGTEKPMEFAFINGVLRSRLFPPQDPWLSGYAISYYYFGYVMLGVLIRLSGVAPAIGFNLGVAFWYALVMVTAFGVGHALIGLSHKDQASAPARGIRYGLLAALLVGFAGNLQGLIDTAYQRGLLPVSMIRWLDIKQLTDAPPTGNWTGGFWWWWRASRVIHDKDLLGNSVEVIDEFPFFSFLLGDLHPHVLALPFALLSIGLALNLLLQARELGWSFERRGPEMLRTAPGVLRLVQQAARTLGGSLGRLTGLAAPGVFLYAVVLGALGFLNTWDFPIYVGLSVLALAGGLAQRDGLTWAAVGRALAAGALLGALGWLLYLPFYIGFQSQLGGILPNLLFPSRFSQFFIMFGLFLTVIVFYLALLSRGRGRPVLRSSLAAAPWTFLLPVAALVLFALLFMAFPAGRQFAQEVLNSLPDTDRLPERSIAGLLNLVVSLRAATPWTWLVLAALIAWTVGTLWASLRGARAGAQPSAGGKPLPAASFSSGDLFALCLIGVALLLALVPEFVYLRDLFGTRMNTVFKFYYQAWAMLALAAAYGISRLAERQAPLGLKAPGLGLALLLIVGSVWYPLAAIPNKADNFRGEPTLDGLAYLRRYDPGQVAAIEWLAANAAPDAVVLEASGGSYSDAARVSMATGNPTLLGWDFHERQWRGNAGYDRVAAGRVEALNQIYRSARPEELLALLDQWGIDYVYIGAQERAQYGVNQAALARFDRVLKLMYDRDGVRIYAR